MEIYRTPFVKIIYEAENRLLLFIWEVGSDVLDPEDVQRDIMKIADFVREFNILNVIVDARNYAFRNNKGIQNWINYQFMPRIFDSTVRKYGIIVDPQISAGNDNNDNDEHEDLLIGYFPEIEQARKWIKT